jgi:methanogenic corrinoid protein MtbC1
VTSPPSREPVFNIKSVSERTGIAPVTLRAWERRYGFPEPRRTETGYRLFSEYDIAALNWLKRQTESGLSIARAVRRLTGLIERGEDPLVKGMAERAVFENGWEDVVQVRPALLRALLALDEVEANAILRTARLLFPLERILAEIIRPVLVEIGEKWHAGEISVAAEHFASHQCRRFLDSAYEETQNEPRRGSIVAACAPGELHELGLLTLAVMLRSRGWAVTYLGANIGFERFAETAARVRPQLLLFSAATRETAGRLMELAGVLDELPEPRPVIGLGGQAFIADPALANRIPGTIMGPTAEEAVGQIERMLGGRL